jgi:1,4-alpha-glucan branching enzyme
VQEWVRELNSLYRTSPALHRDDASWADFDWLSCDDAAQSVLVWRRGEGDDTLVVVINLTPVPRPHYGLPVTAPGMWQVLLNSDESRFGGSGYDTAASVDASDNGFGGNVAVMSLPPLSMLILRRHAG